MSEKIKFNPSSKVINFPNGGKVRNVNSKDYVDPTIDLKEAEFDAATAGVKHGRRADWNDFQVMGSSNKAEGEYVPPKEVEDVDLEAIIGKAKAIKFAKTIIGSYDKLEHSLLESAA